MKFFHVVIALVLVTMLPLSAMASSYEIEPGELPDSTVETYPDDLPIFFVETGITITYQPVDYYGVVGKTAVFNVIAIGEVESYQWQYRTKGATTWRNCTSSTPGYNKSTLSPVVSEVRDGYSYRCIISNSKGYVVSSIATLHVQDVAQNIFTLGQIMNLLNTGAAASVTWFSSLMESTGAGTIYIAMMSVVLSVSILLGPLLGSARSGLSDVVHKPIKKKGDDK